MAEALPVLKNFVNGSWTDAETTQRLELIDPSTGDPFAQVPLSEARDVRRAVEAAHAVFPSWRRTPVAERARRINRFRDHLEAEREELAKTIVRENGKTLDEARASVRRGIESTEFALSAPTLQQGSFLEDVSPGVDAELVREPLGVVAGITPFNFPVMVPLWMFPVALVCGNTFILKPSERVPESAQFLAQLVAQSGFPEGVFNLVHGAQSAVEALIADPDVAAISFVGSAPVAHHIYATAAARGKRVQALAGAKNHLIVMPDCDLPRTVDAIMSSAYGSAGERCMAASVVVAVEPVGDTLVSALAERVRALKLGAGADPGTEMGPVIRADHRDKIDRYVRTGEKEGAILAAQGRVPSGSKGFYFSPVLFDHVRPEMTIAREEIFGPVLSVMRAPSLDEAIRMANASPFGNAAALFTRDGRSAREFRYRIEAGMVGINIGVPVPAAYFPFVGWKGSIYGDHAATGRESVAFYTRTKVVTSRWF